MCCEVADGGPDGGCEGASNDAKQLHLLLLQLQLLLLLLFLLLSILLLERCV